MGVFKKLFGIGPESAELTMVAEIVLGRKEEPARLASSAGVTWTPKLAEEWKDCYTRCSGCGVWIKGRRSMWCEYCKNKGL